MAIISPTLHLALMQEEVRIKQQPSASPPGGNRICEQCSYNRGTTHTFVSHKNLPHVHFPTVWRDEVIPDKAKAVTAEVN